MEKKKFMTLVLILVLVLSLLTVKFIFKNNDKESSTTLDVHIAGSSESNYSLKSLMDSDNPTQLLVSYESNCCETKKKHMKTIKEKMIKDVQSNDTPTNFVYLDLSTLDKKNKEILMQFLEKRTISDLPCSLILDKKDIQTLFKKLVIS